jgi:very-short-patch-repair endonuclease
VLRFWDHEVFENIDGVWLVIFDAISPTKHPPETKVFSGIPAGGFND